MNTVAALGNSRDPRLAKGGKFVVFFESSKQEVELEQLRREERLVKVLHCLLAFLLFRHSLTYCMHACFLQEQTRALVRFREQVQRIEPAKAGFSA